MDSPELSMLSSLRGDFKSEDYIQPHYKESYRLAIDRLVSGGTDIYQEFLKGERIGSFLSEDELLFITTHAEHLPPQNHTEEISDPSDNHSSSGTYWPIHSDVETPDLDLGWPEVMHDRLQTNIDLLFHPPRQNNPTIKEVIRKHIQEARQVIGIVMDMFTDVDIFKEIVDASIRGVPVYVLLDHIHLKSFLTMAESLDIKIQQLRNMRVRTVKGQNYLCRSGAKFHGTMEQKFLLVDCHTAIYGSYSFTWSFEKINLSMVQVIKGHLVHSYDEEFRTLYARSVVPAELVPSDGLFQCIRPHGRQILPNSYSGQKLDRTNQLRHTLDTVYRKTRERQPGIRDFEERFFEDELCKHEPMIENGISIQNQMSQLQPPEAMNYLKRHSYAGERQDGGLPQNIRPRASNWNISRELGNGTNDYLKDNYFQVPQIQRGQNMRQTYNGNDKQVLSVQQNMPPLEITSKSFMRSWRLESYLKNPDIPYGDSCDYLDQFEPMDKNNCYMQGRMRSSLVLRSTIPEQIESDRHINCSTGVGSSAAPNASLHYSSMQWNPTSENRMTNDEFMLKRQSSQILDDNRNNTNYGPGRNSYHPVYSSLGRSKDGHRITNPDNMTDNWQKRHSVADPRSNTEYMPEGSAHMYGVFGRINRSTAGINMQNEYGSVLKEDQRSISHYDVKGITSSNSPSPSNWQEPPSRTVSAAVLDVTRKHLTRKPNGMGPQPCTRNSSNQIKSLLNIPEKKEDLFGNMETSSLKSGGSTDTITAEDECKSMTNSVRSSSQDQRNQPEDHPNSSKPRFKIEEHRHPLQMSLSNTTAQKKPGFLDKSARTSLNAGNWKDRGAENRVYSRFEPFCSFEKKNSQRTAPSFGNTNAQVKSKSLPKGDTAAEHNFTRPARGHHENKLEKFFQRVGNLIHKNKQ